MLTVRRGQLNDLPAVLELLAKVWEDDYVPGCWADWVVKPDEGIVLVALAENLVVGTCYVHFQGDDQCWFQALRVHPAHRRLGVGSALTQGSLAEARRLGRRVAYLGIDADNTASLTMTARAGFRQMMSYQRLRTELDALGGGGTWREATAEDASLIHEMLSAYATRHALPEALFTQWEWQELSLSAVVGAIQRQELWIWEDHGARVVSGVHIYEDEVGVFSPIYATKNDLFSALAALQPIAIQQRAKQMELWLPVVDQVLQDLIQRLGYRYETDDAFVIWRYDL